MSDRDTAVRDAVFIITLLFIILESGPIVVRLLSPTRSYEEKLKKDEEGYHAKIQAASSRIHQEIEDWREGYSPLSDLDNRLGSLQPKCIVDTPRQPDRPILTTLLSFFAVTTLGILLAVFVVLAIPETIARTVPQMQMGTIITIISIVVSIIFAVISISLLRKGDH